MAPCDRKWLEEIIPKHLKEVKTVLDVGSRDINGNPRDLFSYVSEYVGMDSEAGRGVDIVAINLMSLDLLNAFDLVLLLNVLEHDKDFMGTLGEAKRLVKPNGYMAIITPTFGFPIHRHPKDYWRFGEDAYREVLMEGFDILDLREEFTKPEKVNPVIMCLGKKV